MSTKGSFFQEARLLYLYSLIKTMQVFPDFEAPITENAFLATGVPPRGAPITENAFLAIGGSRSGPVENPPKIIKLSE